MKVQFRAPLARVRSSIRLGRAIRLVWRASRREALQSVLLAGFQAVVPLALLYLMKLIVDRVAAGVSGTGPAGFGEILFLIGLAAGVGLLGSALASVSGLVREILGHQVTDHVLDVLHRKSFTVDLAYYENPAYHDTLHRAQQEAPFRPTRVLDGLLQVAQNGLTVVGLVLLLATVHPLLSVLLFVAVLPGLFVRVRYADRSYRWFERRAAFERHANYLSWIVTNPETAKEVRAFELGPTLSERFRTLRDLLRGEKIRLARHRSLGELGAQAVAAIAVLGAYALIAWRTYQGSLSLGDLVMYFGAVQSGQGLMQSLFSSLGSLYEDNLFLAHLDEFLTVESRILPPENPRPVPRPWRDGMRLEGVSFRYPGGTRPLLEDIDLNIRPGEIVALVGPNGAGKTTIAKLLLRLYDPDAGRITLDGRDLREFRPKELRREIAVVFQDFNRYFLTARDNIWFGDVTRDPGSSRIEEAARTAGGAEIFRTLPKGYETVLGRLFPEGEELSLGEWQKIALARAFFRDAPFLIVDEPTSALDAAAEAELFTTMRSIVSGRAGLLISHRFSTVRMADRIYVLEAGHLTENGSHDELLRLGGTYARLFSLQAAPYREPPGPLLT